MKKKYDVIVGYKGFDKDWKCQGMQYAPEKTFTHKGMVSLCSSGLHFCENPFDILIYYPLIGSKFAQVEASGATDETSEDSKRVARELHVKTELSLDGFIKAGFKFIYDSVDWKKAKDSTSATSGEYAHSATSGNRAHSATSGNRAHSATSGEYAHSATSGNRAHSATSGNGAHSATSGEYAHSATSGEYAHSATSGNDAHSATSGNGAHSATSGEYAHSATSGNDANSATSGEYAHSATSGNRANSATSGYGAHSATSGNDAIACSVGRKASAKGSKGCWIVLAEWQEGDNFEDAKPADVKAVKVDGKKIKADTFYKLEDGKFVEVEE